MSSTLTLAPRLDSPAADALARELAEARGAAIRLDAGAVTFCGALTLQLLLSARRQWQADGHPFEMDAPSQDMTDACRLLGVSPEDIGILHETGEPQ
ncbi:STAS domain-containing protein [Marinibacterium profundimaris]|uniref:STAS domain-containing protein n=1 Tax=Marinibacterium profundimaris TaxID=1679460 RepID=UPI000B523AE0|nr:STAS domain-containing protein [Marinibacterium profundimaris]